MVAVYLSWNPKIAEKSPTNFLGTVEATTTTTFKIR